jgi:hypothetical protein
MIEIGKKTEVEAKMCPLSQSACGSWCAWYMNNNEMCVLMSLAIGLEEIEDLLKVRT